MSISESRRRKGGVRKEEGEGRLELEQQRRRSELTVRK